MFAYTIKRILLMIPTFLVIVLITFLVLNLAPGRPGGAQVSNEGTQSSTSAEARESYRIFKEQFNLDKPVLVNTRFGLEASDVLHHVRVLADYQRPTCPEEAGAAAPEGCIPAEEKPLPGEVIEAQETLEDWGSYGVPHLLEIAAEHERLDVRRIAAGLLVPAGKLRLRNEYGRNPSEADRDYNRMVTTHNLALDRWVLPEEADGAAVDALIAEKWRPWFEEHREERFDYGFGDKLVIFFSDTRFAKYLANLATLNFGISHVDKQPVAQTIWEKLKYTIPLSLLSIMLAYFISLPLGIWSAYRKDTTADRVVTVILFMLYSLPSFFTAVLLQEYLTDGDPLKLFPTGGFSSPNVGAMTTLEYLLDVGWHLVLPVFCLTYGALATLSRYARTGLLDVINADYIRTARAKGLSETMVVAKHAVRNGMIPILTLLGSLLPALIGGSVIIEVIFNIPGMGLYLFESITLRDYNAIMGVLLSSTVLTLIGLLISDLSYALVDPRISFD